MLTQVQDNKQTLKQYETKYEGKALMAVIAGSTPSNIRLLSFSADFGGISDQPAKDQKNENKIEKRLTLEGIIFGNRLTFESSLAGYMVQLKKSPMFGKASVKKRNMEFIDDQEVMKFTAQLDLL